MENKTVSIPSEGQLLIYQDGALQVQVRLDGKTVWLTQRLMAELYQVSVKTVSEHLMNIYAHEHLCVRRTGPGGYRVRSGRGTAFRQWATARLSELLVKGFTMDDERIKAGRTLGDDYFEELLERIREIRASERLFCQKITDIYATSIDYDPSAGITETFFATAQNKLHWAIHGHTAAEIIYHRAEAGKPHLGLNTWKNAPNGPVRKTDVTIAKDYLTEEEIRELNRIVTMYLDYAEDQARRHKPMHMAHWVKKLDAFLQFNERNILVGIAFTIHFTYDRKDS